MALQFTSPFTAMQHTRMVDFLRETLAGFDADHIAYLIRRQIAITSLPPQWMKDAAGIQLLGYADLMLLSEEAKLRGACEARPDLAELLQSDAGREWLRALFTW